MELNAIILELLSRIQVLEQKVAALESRNEQPTSQGTRPAYPADKISPRYKKLAEYLYQTWETSITLTYEAIQEILGFVLPNTAYHYPHSYWANTDTHSYSSAWMALGYKAKVDIETKEVTFERSSF